MRAPTAAWRKAPLLLVRLPALGAAVAAGALVLALATASAPLFLASAGNAALRLALEGTTPQAAGLTVETLGLMQAGRFDSADEAVRAATTRAAPLPEPTVFGLSQQLRVLGSGGEDLGEVRLLLRAGALDNVDKTGPGGDGLWLPDTVARRWGLEPGDDVTIGFSQERSHTRVAGVYRDLVTGGPLTDFWRPFAPLILPRDPPNPSPPPLALTDRSSFLAIGADLPVPAEIRWEAPLDPSGLTLPEARAVGATLAGINVAAQDANSPLGAPLSELSAYGDVDVHTAFPPLLRDVADTQTALSGPIGLLSLAGRAVALVVLAAAAAFAAQRRRVEHQVFAAAGERPVAAAARAAVEALAPVAAGTALGIAAAGALVDVLGPGAAADAAVRAAAIRQAVVTALAGLAVFGLVTAAVGRRPPALASGAGTGRRRLAARVPWEPVLLALAAASFYEVTVRADAVAASGEARGVDALVLAFPLLFLAAGAGLVGRLQRRLLPRLRSAASHAGPARYLAARQLAGASQPALLLVAASTLAVGIGVYAGVLVATTLRTVEAKAQVLVGADAAIPIDDQDAPTVREGFPSTVVQRADAEIDGRVRVDVLGVDPATLAAVVAWDDRFADRSLDDLLAALRAPVASGRLPVLAVGGGVPDQPTLESATFSIPMDVVARPDAFPGASSGRPLLVVDADRYIEAANIAARSSIDARLLFEPFLWVRGPAAPIAAALEVDRADPDAITTAIQTSTTFRSNRPDIVTAAGAARQPGLASLVWTFGYLQALGLATALLAVVGLLLYLQARQADREVAYALSRRMGLTRGAHCVAVALEVTGMLAVALAAGTLLALAAAWLVNGRLDPLPQVPPAPLFTVPGGLLLAVAATLPLLAVAGAVLVQRAADRTRVAEVLRVAG